MIEKLKEDFYSTRIRGGSTEGVVTCDGEMIIKKLNEVIEAVNRIERLHGADEQSKLMASFRNLLPHD